MNFMMGFFISAKIIIGIRIVLNLQIALSSIDILAILSSNPWTWDMFPFIRVFNFFQHFFLWFSLYKSFTSLVNSQVFILFDTILYWADFLITFQVVYYWCIEMHLVFGCQFWILLLCWIHLFWDLFFFFFGEIFRFSTYKIKSSASRDNCMVFSFPIRMPFISFSCQIALAELLVLSWIEVVTVGILAVSLSYIKPFSSSALKMMLVVGFSCMAFIMLI